MTAPAHTETEAANRNTFLALMWALSYPGRIYTLTDAPSRSFVSIASALLDLETSFYTPDPALEMTLRQTTARPATIATAAYIFFSSVTESDLTLFEQASVGDMLFPDKAATLILGCTFGSGPLLALSGPGVNDIATVHVSGLPPGFWALRERMRRYPLGWDIFLVAGADLIGIPRSSAVEIIQQG